MSLADLSDLTRSTFVNVLSTLTLMKFQDTRLTSINNGLTRSLLINTFSGRIININRFRNSTFKQISNSNIKMTRRRLSTLTLNSNTMANTSSLGDLKMTVIGALSRTNRSKTNRAILNANQARIVDNNRSSLITFGNDNSTFQGRMKIEALNTLNKRILTFGLSFGTDESNSKRLAGVQYRISTLLSRRAGTAVSPPVPQSERSF